ncbi:hypothetical protein AKI39_23625 [Bordetella sp. H567]|nr:hypothetical protein AKI39_23625 [Bordetella sp. H567]
MFDERKNWRTESYNLLAYTVLQNFFRAFGIFPQLRWRLFVERQMVEAMAGDFMPHIGYFAQQPRLAFRYPANSEHCALDIPIGKCVHDLARHPRIPTRSVVASKMIFQI